MAKATRTSISVPPDLKARMDAVDEPVNWSAVACRAFEAKLAEIATRKGVREMKDVVQRLRASQQQAEDKSYKEGFEAGKEWAMREAEAPELRRLASLKQRLRHDWEYAMFSTDEHTSAYGPAERLLFAVQPDTDGDRQLAAERWAGMLIGCSEDNAERLACDGEFVHGFAEGALDVWSEVENQL
jgi:hypothetical protein